MPVKSIPSYKDFSKKFTPNQVSQGELPNMNWSQKTFIVSVQATIKPLTYNQLAMNWVQSLFVIHHQTSKEAEEHFQQCE